MKNRGMTLLTILAFAAIISGCSKNKVEISNSEYVVTETNQGTEKIREVIETNTTEDTEMIYAEDNNYIDDEDTEAVETKDKVKTNNVSDENVSAKKNVQTNSDTNVEEVSDVPYPEYYDAEYAEWTCPHCGCLVDNPDTLGNWLRYYDEYGVCGDYPWNGDNYVDENGKIMLWSEDPGLSHAGYGYREYLPTRCGYCNIDYTMYESHVGGESTYYGDAQKILWAHAASVHGMYFDFIDYSSIPNELWDIAEQQ